MMSATPPAGLPPTGPRRATPAWTPTRPPSRRAGILLYIGGGLTVLVALALVVGLSAARRVSVPRERRARLAVVADGPTVRVAAVERSPGAHTLTLTGETRQFLSVALYAKVSG